MTKYYDIYTQIPGIKPRAQKWVTAEDKMDIINQLLRNGTVDVRASMI